MTRVINGILRRLTTVLLTNLTMMFVLFIFLVLLFKLIHLNQNLYFVLLHTERVELVIESISNVVYFEGCNKIKKVSSCHTGMSKLSLGFYNI
jgi:hypothetical protein